MDEEKSSWLSAPSRTDNTLASSQLVRDLMTQKPFTCTKDFSLQAVAQLMKDHKIGIVPVVDGKKPTGVLTDRDLAVQGYAMGISPAATVSTILSRDQELGLVYEDDQLKTAESVFKRMKVRRLLVLDRATSDLVGILSLDDMALGLGHKRAGAVLESIVAGSL